MPREIFLWDHCSFPLGLGVHNGYLLSSKTGVSGSPSPVDIMKSCLSSRSDSLGITSPFVEFPGWEAWCAVQNLHTVRKLLWYYCSPVCGSPTQLVWDLILLWFCPSYHLGAASSLSLDVGYRFLVGSGILLSMRVQWLLVILVLLQEMSTHSSTLPSWLKLWQSLPFKAFTHVNNCWQWIACLNQMVLIFCDSI